MAAEICGEYERSGKASEFELSGAAEAKVKGLFKNFVDAGVEASGSRSGSAYDGVVRQELSKELESTRNCRQDMSKFLIDKLSAAQPVNPPDRIEPINPPTPVISLAGDWSFQGTCPNPGGFGTVPVSGGFQMQQTGPYSYQGNIFNNFGNYGTFQTQASGNQAVSQIVWSDYSVGQANGVLSQNGRVMDIQDTSGCFTRAIKTN